MCVVEKSASSTDNLFLNELKIPVTVIPKYKHKSMDEWFKNKVFTLF